MPASGDRDARDAGTEAGSGTRQVVPTLVDTLHGRLDGIAYGHRGIAAAAKVILVCMAINAL